MTQLSPHFTLEELTDSATATAHGIDNTAPSGIVYELTRLCENALERARAIWGVPVHVNSGYRCPALNSAVGGAATSEHLFGRAADLVPSGLNLLDAFNAIRTSDVEYDQLIIEDNEWIHIGMPAAGDTPRRQALVAVGHKGAWHYTPYTA